MEQKIKQVVAQLKSVRLEKGISYQQIVDQCEANGDYVSLSSVKRVFSSGSEDMSFRYDTTIRPIAKVVLGYDNDHPLSMEAQSVSESSSEVDALKAVLSLKNEIITALNHTIDTKDQEIERLMSASERQLDTRESNVSYLKSIVDEQKRSLLLMRIGVILLLLLIIVALVIDKINPGIGFFWVG